MYTFFDQSRRKANRRLLTSASALDIFSGKSFKCRSHWNTKMRIVLPAIALILVFNSLSFAQKAEPREDGSYGIFNSVDEYSSFMGSAKQEAYGPNGTPEMRAMIPMLNDIALDRPVGWTANNYNLQASDMGMLSDKAIRSELEMVDDQYKQLQELSGQIQKDAASQIRGLDFSDANWLEQVRKIREQAKNQLNSVLLPHQQERLRQIRMQSQMRRRTLVEIITNDPFKTELEITDDQATELRQSEKEIEKKLAEDIAKLREKAREKLLSNLKSKQREKVELLIGQPFEFVDSPKEQNRKGKNRSKSKGSKGSGK